ncbi:MAG: DNA-directed polymerase sigma subunit (sigma70/sigma32)-like protein, partial [Sphaerisporangium sp.]|nr:DNA-directed polymerase sigma subunit (sigma70/sigma32)-like protein [Sphaerisporangium sp.]
MDSGVMPECSAGTSRFARPSTEKKQAPLAGTWVHSHHAFVREVFVSPASSTRSKPSELNEPVIQRLIERGRSQGFLESEDVRKAFEEADIPMSHAAGFLRNLSKEGVTVVVTAADSAAPKRSRGPAKRRTAAAPVKKTKTATAAAKEQPDTVTAVVSGAGGEASAPAEKPAAKKPVAKKAAPAKKAASAPGAPAKVATPAALAKKAKPEVAVPASPSSKIETKPKVASEDDEEIDIEGDIELEDLDLDIDVEVEAEADTEPAEAVGPEVEVEVEAEAEVEVEVEEETKPGVEVQSDDEVLILSDDDDDAPVAQVAAAGATADPVKDYLKQIGKVPLLNAEQEVELAKRIEAGLFAEEQLANDGERLPVDVRAEL